MANDNLPDEAVRLLRAARAGRLVSNDVGRWVIVDEKRPDRKTREKLMNSGLLTWRFHPVRALELTTRGQAALDNAERAS